MQRELENFAKYCYERVEVLVEVLVLVFFYFF